MDISHLPISFLALGGAAFFAGAMNALAGGGSFITFPALLLTGLDPRAANITNTVALFPGQIASGWAGRHLAQGVGDISFTKLVLISLAGGAVGALLLLATPPSFFAAMVPYLVLFATLVFAWILILTGMIGLISAFAGRSHSHLGWSLASAVIALAIGGALFAYPLAGAVAMTWVIGAYLLMDGVVLIGLGLDHRKRGLAQWGWLLASGGIDLLLAAFILFMSAIGSAVLVGVIVGLSLMAAGVAMLAAHRAESAPA